MKTTVTRVLGVLAFMLIAVFAFSQLPSGQSAQLLLPTGPGNAEKIIEGFNNSYMVMGKGNLHAYMVTVKNNGQTIYNKNFGSVIGGIRSEITDGVKVPGGFIVVGDCDGCTSSDPEDETRRIFVMKTDPKLNVKKVIYMNAPVVAGKDYKMYGFQKMRKDATGGKLFIASQLLYGSDQQRQTDFSLSQIDTNLLINSHRAVDVNPLDNIGGMEIVGSDCYVLTYGVKDVNNLQLGTDSISLLRLNSSGEVLGQNKFPGIGLCMTRLTNGNWIIGGAETKDFVKGPQALLVLVNGQTGKEIRRTSFGIDGKIDLLTDVRQLANGGIITTATTNQSYPDLNYLLYNYNLLFLDPDSIPYPRSAQVNLFNPTFLSAIGAPVKLNNPNLHPVVLRNVLPVSEDGKRFIAVGYDDNRSLLFSRYGVTISTLTDSGDQAGEVAEREDQDAIREGQTAVYPNPVPGNAMLNISVSAESDQETMVELFDMSGRPVVRRSFRDQEQFQMEAPGQSGLYVLRISVDGRVRHTTRLSVE